MKVKLIVRRAVERSLPLSDYIPIPVLIVLLMVMFLREDGESLRSKSRNSDVV